MFHVPQKLMVAYHQCASPTALDYKRKQKYDTYGIPS